MTLIDPSDKIAGLMRRLVVLTLWISLSAGVAFAAAPEIEGLRAYVAGRFDEAAIGLKQSIREQGKAREANADKAQPVSGQTAYFAGRAFQELGLRGLALHYLAQAELYGSPAWRLLARRELVQLYFEVTDYAAVMQVIDRMAGEPEDPEIYYFAGLAAADLRAWPQAIDVLGRVPTSSGYSGYARYARAQSLAANGDLDGALADLDAVIAKAAAEPQPRRLLFLFSSSSGRSVALLEEARVLRGKILYLQSRTEEARASFEAVLEDGAMGFEAVRGLLITGAGVDAAAKVEVSRSRPVDRAALLTVKAVVAEDHDDPALAGEIRTEVRDLAKTRLAALDRLSSSNTVERDLEADLAEFWQRLRRARWQQRWQQEEMALPADVAGAMSSPPSVAAGSFEPRDPVFYGVWDQSRVNAWLRGLIELRAFSERLVHDIETAPKRRSFWKFWRADDDLRLADALLIIQVTNIRQRLADHLHNFAGLDDVTYKARKREAAEDGVRLLNRLYLGDGKVPPFYANLEKGLEYKRFDIFRLEDAVPERATDPVISLFGNYVDMLADLRVYVTDAPKASAESPAALEHMRAANEAIAAELSGHIQKAIEPTRRSQVAFFTRIEADNEGSLSKLYGRLGGSGQGEEAK